MPIAHGSRLWHYASLGVQVSFLAPGNAVVSAAMPHSKVSEHRRPTHPIPTTGSTLMRRLIRSALNTGAAFVGLGLLTAPALSAQSFTTNDPVLRDLWRLGMEQSQVYTLAQALTDSVGPRLTASPGQDAAHDWAVRTYASMGIDARS